MPLDPVLPAFASASYLLAAKGTSAGSCGGRCIRFFTASATAPLQDGVYGVKILGYGMSGCIFGSGFITYSLIGFFGAVSVGNKTYSSETLCALRGGNVFPQLHRQG